MCLFLFQQRQPFCLKLLLVACFVVSRQGGTMSFEIFPFTTNCIAGVQCRVFEHRNDHQQKTSLLFESTGKIMFESGNTVTEWHGCFREDAMGAILFFSCKGDTANMKSTRLFLIGPGQYTGFDHEQETIQMKLVKEWQWCETCKLWHPL